MSGLWGGSKDVFIQSNTSIPFLYRMIREDKIDIVLTSPITTTTNIVNVDAGHGFVVGSSMVLWNSNGYFQQLEVKSVDTNEITLYAPIVLPYAIADTMIVRGTYSFNVNGSSTEQIWSFIPRYISAVDIGGVNITMRHTGEGNLGLFGDLAELTNGCLFQKRNSMTIPYSFYRKTGDFIKLGVLPEFTNKAAGGKYGTIIMIDVNKPERFDAVSRFFSIEDDILEWIVRDDLTVGGSLEEAELAITGSYTVDE